MNMRKRYVLGFVFDRSLTLVLLIRKNKPEWQKDLLNGLGGKIEPDETEVAAMQREFKEECGVEITQLEWKEFFELVGNGFSVHCFCCCNEPALIRASTKTHEKVGIYNVSKVKSPGIVPNLEWLIPLAKNAITEKIKGTLYYE